MSNFAFSTVLAGDIAPLDAKTNKGTWIIKFEFRLSTYADLILSLPRNEMNYKVIFMFDIS